MIHPPLVQGFTNIHTALLGDLKNIETSVKNHQQMTNQELERLNKWFDFYWIQLEAHHKGEERYFFPAIGKYDATFLAGVNKLTVEHNELDQVYADLKDNYPKLLWQPAGPERENLYQKYTQLLSTLYTTLAEHLEHEQALMFPAIIKNILEKEQKDIDNGYLKKLPKKDLVTMAPWLMANITPEQRNWLYKTSPWIMKVLYNLSWKKKYEILRASFQV